MLAYIGRLCYFLLSPYCCHCILMLFAVIINLIDKLLLLLG